MATAAAGLLSASIRRLSTRSVAARRRLYSSFTNSSMVLREVTGSHKVTIDGYTLSKKIIEGWSWTSSFEAVGYRWKVWYGPYGHKDSMGNQHISLYLQLKHDGAVEAEFKFSLLDQSGNPVPEFTRATTGLCAFNEEPRRHGFEDFIRWKDLEESGCLKDDQFAVQCDITTVKNFVKDGEEGAAAAHGVVVPPSDLLEHRTEHLWEKKQGADVTVDVGGEAAFDAHEWLLAARSLVFRAELLANAASKEKKPGGGGRRIVEVRGVEPRVFQAMLHYMYTDALPETTTAEGEPQDAAAMAQGLLAAAHRFELGRLKLMCEEMLAKRIDVNTVADTLAAAERHGCRGLRAACLKFMASPANLKAVMATEGFERLRANCPNLLAEIVLMKQLAT